MKQDIPVHNTDNGNSNKNVHLLEKKIFHLLKKYLQDGKVNIPNMIMDGHFEKQYIQGGKVSIPKKQ